MAVKQGWTGRVFEDFTVGDIYEHPLGRTILDADNIWFTCLTMNTNPIHFDGEYAAQTEFKRRLVNSCFTLSLVTGQSVTDLTMNGVANLGWDEVRLPHPVFEGDTIYSRSEVLEVRESKSRPKVGHRPRQDDRRQSGQDAGDRVHAHVHDLEARARPDAAALKRRPTCRPPLQGADSRAARSRSARRRCSQSRAAPRAPRRPRSLTASPARTTGTSSPARRRSPDARG